MRPTRSTLFGLASVTALAAGVSSSLFYFARTMPLCIDSCSADIYAEVPKNLIMAYLLLSLAFIGLIGLLTLFEGRLLRIAPVAVGLTGTLISGLIVSPLGPYETGGLPFRYWITSCLGTGALPICSGGTYRDFSMYLFLTDFLLFSLVGFVVSIWLRRGTGDNRVILRSETKLAANYFQRMEEDSDA